MRLAEMIRCWRERNRYGVRELAKEIGTSPSTLNRFERGEAIDATTFLKIFRWATEERKP